MQDKLVFKAGLAKQALGWFVLLGSAAALVGLGKAVYENFATQSSADLWSGAAIAVFLLGFMVAGIAIQRMQWSIEGETIVVDSLFGQKRIPVSGLSGYGKLIFVVSLFPLAHIELYDGALKWITRLPVTFRDLPVAEAWLADRLRYVVNDGSPALPKLRFVDEPRQ